MEEPQPDSGTDPPQPGSNEIKTEPMDADSVSDPTENSSSLELNENGADKVARSEFRAVPFKEEIKDEDDDDDDESEAATPNYDADIYCFCRKKGCTEFMIACEKCDIWFHDTCVMIDSQMSNHIVSYYCDTCVAEHGCKTVYKATYEAFMQKRERAAKAAHTRKLKKEQEMAHKMEKMAMTEIRVEVNDMKEVVEEVEEIKKEEPAVEEKNYEPRAPRCNECINCASVKNCEQCHYCRTLVGRCIKVMCLTEVVVEKIEATPEATPTPTLSPKGSAKRKTQRKRKSGGDSDDDELFFSESTSTRKIIKKELSYKEEQQLVDVDSCKKKRGRKKGWRKAVDGKKKEKVEKKVINRVGKGALFEKENGPENSQFERPGYDTSVVERLDTASAAYASLLQEKGLITENKKGEKCKNEGCSKERRDEDNYCGEECGMAAAQKRLQCAGLLPKPLELPKRKRQYQKRKEENDENRKLEQIAAAQEADFIKRKRMAEMEKESDQEEEANGGDMDLISATFRRMQRDVEKKLQVQQEEEERRQQEAEAAAEAERLRKQTEDEYRKLTSYVPVGSATALDNALRMLMSQKIVRPTPVYPTPGTFPPMGYFNPLLSPFNNPFPTPANGGTPPGFGLQPSFPMPISSSLITAMMDHNDYLLQPILPFPQNASPPDHSTPSTLSTASPSAPPPQSSAAPSNLELAVASNLMNFSFNGSSDVPASTSSINLLNLFKAINPQQ